MPAESDDQGPVSADVVAAFVESVTQGADVYGTAVEQRELLRIPVRCLVTTRQDDNPDDPALGESATLCVTEIGAMLLADTPSGTVTAVEYSTDVDDDAFELPAPVGG